MDIYTQKNSKVDFENTSISVSELNKLAKTLLENNMPIFWIKGEVSGFKLYNHGYFDLKDENAKISCVIFARTIASLGFKLENGQQIEVRGRVTIYPVNGSYQINVERVRQLGIGDLWEAYHRLLNKLRLEGLFLEEHKKKLPIFPRVVGVITSKEGAVIKDVISTLTRRAPHISVIVYHTLVQGADASMGIANAIKNANIRNEVDVLIVCRGGGSMEDLWCFNSEVVAREAYQSKIPLISAIGHETDTTIIDYVADLRAPTPTAAAEIVAKGRMDWLNDINNLSNQLTYRFNSYINYQKQLLDSYISQINLINPIIKIGKLNQEIVNLQLRLTNRFKQLLVMKQNKLDRLSDNLITPIAKVNGLNQDVINLQLRLNNNFRHLLLVKQNELNKLANQIKFDKSSLKKYDYILKHLEVELKKKLIRKISILTTKVSNMNTKLSLLNPHSVLDRGYVILKNKSGKAILNSSQVKHNERLEIMFKDDALSVIADKNYNPDQNELI